MKKPIYARNLDSDDEDMLPDKEKRNDDYYNEEEDE